MPREFARFRNDFNGHRVTTIPVSSPRRLVVKPGEIAVQDADPITDPENEIPETRDLIDRELIGTYMGFQLGYDSGLTGITNPVIKLFGKYSDADAHNEHEGWDIVESVRHELVVELKTDPANDVVFGDLQFTTLRMGGPLFDVGRFRQLLVGVETPLSATGDTSTAIVVARMWG